MTMTMKEVQSAGGASAAPLPILYNDLLTLQLGGTLVPGQQYRITDFSSNQLFSNFYGTTAKLSVYNFTGISFGAMQPTSIAVNGVPVDISTIGVQGSRTDFVEALNTFFGDPVNGYVSSGVAAIKWYEDTVRGWITMVSFGYSSYDFALFDSIDFYAPQIAYEQTFFGSNDQILVKATSVNSFDPVAMDITNDNDIIEYDIVDNTLTAAPLSPTATIPNSKGRIIKRKMVYSVQTPEAGGNIEAQYDWRNTVDYRPYMEYDMENTFFPLQSISIFQNGIQIGFFGPNVNSVAEMATYMQEQLGTSAVVLQTTSYKFIIWSTDGTTYGNITVNDSDLRTIYEYDMSGVDFHASISSVVMNGSSVPITYTGNVNNVRQVSQVIAPDLGIIPVSTGIQVDEENQKIYIMDNANTFGDMGGTDANGFSFNITPTNPSSPVPYDIRIADERPDLYYTFGNDIQEYGVPHFLPAVDGYQTDNTADIYIGKYTLTNVHGITWATTPNSIIFGGSSKSIRIEDWVSNGIFYGSVTDVSIDRGSVGAFFQIGSSCTAISIGKESAYNLYIGSGCYGITIGDANWYGMYIPSGAYDWTIGEGMAGDVFGYLNFNADPLSWVNRPSRLEVGFSNFQLSTNLESSDFYDPYTGTIDKLKFLWVGQIMVNARTEILTITNTGTPNFAVGDSVIGINTGASGTITALIGLSDIQVHLTGSASFENETNIVGLGGQAATEDAFLAAQINSIANDLLNHQTTIFPIQGETVTVNDNSMNGGNIYLENSSVFLIGDKAQSLVVQVGLNNAAKIVQIGGSQPITI